VRTPVVLGFVLTWCFVGTALGQYPTEAGGQAHAVADLDCDGRPEAVDVFFFRPEHGYGAEVFLMAVNKVIYAGKGCALDERLAIVDIDTTDQWKEIALPEAGPSDDYATHFFRYMDREIVPLGTLPERLLGPPGIDGSGVVHTRCRGHILQTWWYPCEFRVASDQSEFVAVNKRYRHIGTSVVLKLALPLTSVPRGRDTVAVLRPGQTATLLRTDDEHWCEIESSSGVRGWFAVAGWYIPAANASPTEVFDGLCIAD
jgi:hypothetical protein